MVLMYTIPLSIWTWSFISSKKRALAL